MKKSSSPGCVSTTTRHGTRAVNESYLSSLAAWRRDMGDRTLSGVFKTVRFPRLWII
jgi:hypothetical protein